MATKYRRGQSWYLQYYEKGRQIRRSIGAITETEAEAERLAHEEKQLADHGAGAAFAAWAVEYAAWHSQEYPDSYFRVEQILRSHLIPFFGAWSIGAITPQLVDQYKHSRAAAPATIAKEVRTLKACLNKAVEFGRMPVNPSALARPPRDTRAKPPRWYTADEMNLIYAADPVYRAVWQLMVNTGMRRAEAFNLTWRDVGDREVRIVSEPEARTKSGKWRVVPCFPGAAAALTALRNDSDYVLPRMTPESLSRACARTLTRANLDGSMHSLRHTFCSHLVMRGVPLRAVQQLAGHANYATTEKYAHLAPDYFKGLPELAL